MTQDKGEDWTKAIRCVLDGYVECAARVPEACICAKMPKHVYLECLMRLNGEITKP
jgi:hypothetical protein